VVILLVAAIAFLISLFLAYRSTQATSIFFILDNPNHRSLHTIATPRGGGIALITAVVLAWNIFALTTPTFDNLLVLNASVLTLSVLGLLDDLYKLKPIIRFAVHLLVAVVSYLFGWGLESLKLPGLELSIPPSIAMIIAILFIIWMLNLYNFMDGMDGFAGGMTLVGFSTFAILGFIQGEQVFATLSLIIAASSLAFLLFNFPPAKLFMGDAGSVTLGFMVSIFALWADNKNIFSLWVSILIFSPFIVDATVTLFKRIYKKKKIWEAHRSHYYQLLVQSGWSHRKTVIFEYYLMLLSSSFAIIAVVSSNRVQWLLLISIFIVYIVLITLYHLKKNPEENEESTKRI